MKTDDLIAQMASAPRIAAPMGRNWALATACALGIALAVFYITIGPRPDFAEAMTTLRFDFKFVLTLTLLVSALPILNRLASPGARRPSSALLAIAPALAALAVGTELLVLPADVWAETARGDNALVCLTYIPVIGLGPLIAFVVGLRHGAPTRPALAGAVAGLAAGGLAATLYAAQCTDDSPLFVALWYPVGIAMLAALGAGLGHFFARW